MTLRSRLAAGLVIIAIILVGPLVFAIQSLHGLHEDAVALRDRDFAASLVVTRLRDGLNDLRREELALLFRKDVASREAMERGLANIDTLNDSLARFQLPALSRDISTSVRQLANAAPSEYAAALASDTARADSLSEHVFVPALTRSDSLLTVVERALRDRTKALVGSQAAGISTATTASIGALILALIIAAAIAFWLTRSITAPILDLKAGMSAVADGDLTYILRVPSTREDELGDLANSFKEMTRQLAELDKLKAEFVSVASHELKTPINVMVGYLQLLEEGIYGPLSPQQLEVHRTLDIQANTLLRLVKQLLDVSRFEAGGGRLEPRRIVLDDLMHDLERAFHVLALQREVHFVTKRTGDLPNEVYWDLDRINEVVGNLLSNAFKFTPHGGTVELDLGATDGSVRMEVRDTGAGIPPEQVHRIFEKFYQADNQRAARAAGSGLGLAIAKQIVEAHGGTISCESTLGVGTTFAITLPTRVSRRSSMRTLTPISSDVVT